LRTHSIERSWDGDFIQVTQSLAEVHRLMNLYRQAGLPQQLWATLTPVSEGWTVAALLAELAAEAQAMRRKREAGKDGP